MNAAVNEAQAPKQRGAPTTYTKAKGLEVCDLIANGWTLTRIQKERPDLGTITTIFQWMDSKPEFAEAYARARVKQADVFADLGRDLLRNCMDEPKNSNAYRVALDVIKWSSAVANPKKYSERHNVEHGGAVGVTFTLEGLKEPSKAQKRHRVR